MGELKLIRSGDPQCEAVERVLKKGRELIKDHGMSSLIMLGHTDDGTPFCLTTGGTNDSIGMLYRAMSLLDHGLEPDEDQDA